MRDNRYDEIRIDPINLVGHLLIKWKIILLFSVVVAAIVGAVAAGIKISRSGDTNGADSSIQSNSAASGLSQEQIAEAEEICDRITEYDRILEDMKVVYKESYIMSLDPDTAVAYYKLYYLETDISNPTSLFSYILNEEDYEKISQLLDPDIIKRGLSDVVSLWVNTTDTTPSYEMDLERSNKLAGEIESRKRLIASEMVYAPDKDSCKGIVEIVDKAIDRRVKALIDQGVYANLALFDEGYYTSTQASLTSSQQGKINSLVSFSNGKTGYINNMLATEDDSEKVYINSLLAGGPKAEESEADVNNNQKTEISWKNVLTYSLIGLGCGFVLSVILLVVRYLTGGKIRANSELPGYFKIPVLQTIVVEGAISKPDMITRWGRLASDGDTEPGDNLVMLTEELNDKAGKEGLRKLYIAVDRFSVDISELLNQICERASEDVKYVVGGLAPSADELKELLASDGVVLIPVLDCTRRKLIKSFLDMCRRNSKNIIGSAPVRDWKVK